MSAILSLLALHMKRGCYLLFISIFIISCGTTKKNPMIYEGEHIIFGNGGGFSGIENSLLINDDGKVFELKDRRTNYTFIKKLSSDDVDQLFQAVNTLGLMEVDKNTPGNTYKFIEIKTDNSENRLVWTSDNVSNDIQILYTILQTKAQ